MAERSIPMWKQAFDKAYGTVAPTIDELAKSEDLAIVVALVAKGREEMRRRFRDSTRRGLHFFNLPAGTDVHRLLEHIARLEGEVRQLRSQLSDRENAEFLAELIAGNAPVEAPAAGRSTAPTTAQTTAKGGARAARPRNAARKDPA